MRIAVLASALGLCIVGLSRAGDADASMRMPTDISAQALRPALQKFSKDRDLQIVFRTDVVGERRTAGAVGELTVDEALTRLLAGTGLTYKFLDEKTITIVAALPAPHSTGDEQKQPPASGTSITTDQEYATGGGSAAKESVPSAPRNAARPVDLEEVVVTGTHIRGAKATAPVLTLSPREMQLAGQASLGDAVRSLPQNFAGGQNPGVAYGAGGDGVANQNLTGGSSLNLRGLGPDATLTLLNGARLPYDGFVQATDLSVIPVAAIERVEILLDGASAIYGSDAVGGVANIILKHDYRGAEVSVRHATATAGGDTQQQYDAVAGTTWDSGGMLATFDYSKNTMVRARQRDYLRYLPNQEVSIYPQMQQRGGVVSAHQRFGELAELTLDAFYADRDMDELQQSSAGYRRHAPSTIYGVSPGLRFDLPHEWSVRVHGFTGRDKGDNYFQYFSLTSAPSPSPAGYGYWNDADEIALQGEGPSFSLPGGKARISVGGGTRTSKFQLVDLVSGVRGPQDSSRSRYAFAEVNLPLLGAAQNIPAVSALAVNAAIRHEDYDTFGSVNTPKLGLVWTIVPGVDFTTSWGKSFKAPTLQQLYTDPLVVLVAPSDIGASGMPAGTTAVLYQGGNRDLGPERAETISAGVVLKPEPLPGLRVELDAFHVDYEDRVVFPAIPMEQAYYSPVLADYVSFAPSVAQLDALVAGASQFINISGTAYDPTKVIAIVDNRSTNAARQTAKGLDLAVAYSTAAWGGTLTLTSNTSWLDSERQLTPRAPRIATTGVVFYPPRFRGRLGAAWTRGGLTTAAYVNHLDGLTDTVAVPNVERASMTTVDWVIDYESTSGVFGGLGLNLAVTNLFGVRPPAMQATAPYTVNYDSTNYSALGRVISATLTKRF
jgi:outer membrane receptor protein involved in Fe transport